MTTTETTTPAEELERLRGAVSAIGSARRDRDRAIRAAREGGATWRTIAAAAGMTEKGVRYALDHAEDQVSE